MAPLQPQQSQKSTAPQPQAQAQGDQLLIQHFTHPHLLQKLFIASEFNCNGCKTRGQGIRYRCSACDFHLHEQCATCPHHLSSHLHPHHHLTLVNRPGNSHFCDVCKGFTDGLSYTCSQMCGFDLHPLCAQIQIPSATFQQQPATTAVGGYHGHGVNNSQPVMVNYRDQQVFGGYTGVNINSKPVMMNQQQPGMPMTSFGGFQGANNNQPPVMMLHQQQQQQGMATPSFGGYNPVMMNMNHHQQQGMPAVGGYHGANSQLVMVNQQLPAIGTTAFGGYNGVNQHQPIPMNMMMNQQQQQQQQVPPRSNSLSKVGKLAANVLMTTLIGVPINFNSRN